MMLILATGFGLGVLLTALAAQPRKIAAGDARAPVGYSTWTRGYLCDENGVEIDARDSTLSVAFGGKK